MDYSTFLNGLRANMTVEVDRVSEEQDKLMEQLTTVRNFDLYYAYNTERSTEIRIEVGTGQYVSDMLSITEAVKRMIAAGYVLGNKIDNTFMHENSMNYLIHNINDGILAKLLDSSEFFDWVF
eukprot:TRINITY_DN4954_c0_g1_i11.p2 TRINITY_DN4954_c0_g1~~TRINITY_DN4954_c0_g1_i11.p2  ORF type:complete len:123 (-),score=32.33 TRINITY_DN4954_c0_g1_i11:684-1052(-)